jgi:biotin synthase-like enzyme
MVLSKRIADLFNQDDLFIKARKISVNKKLLLSSPLIVTRVCKMDPLCRYCSWRAYHGVMKNAANAKINKEEAVARAIRIRQAGIKRVYLVSGWMGDSLPDYFFDYIEALKKNAYIDVVTTFGPVNKTDLMALKEIGVTSVSCGLETTNKEIFRRIKPGDNFEARLKTLQDAKELGFKTATNFIIGVGESLKDYDDGVRLVEQLGIDYLSLGSFCPTPFTEMESWDRPSPYFVAQIAAAARISFPDIDIATCFDCDNSSVNLAWGIKCGANAYSVVLRNPQETPVLAGDELGNILQMWEDSKSINPDMLYTPLPAK